MTYRLHRMIMVNARTSGTSPSGLITELDPRDGAAVIGDNSVGKTTTLELVPLFYGHLPSQISGSGAGKEPMLRYILPTPESAIVFEYQRGGTESTDLRIAVLRRQEANDAPEYRFFKCGFRREFFVQHSEAAGADVFLDDAGTIHAAIAMGLHPERRMTSSEYRSVILGHKAMTQDALKLRRLSMEYSFGPVGTSLVNLDRLVAAVVKKAVNFTDFIKIAVDVVQEEMGSTAAPGGERNKVTLKQSRRQIQDWLSNRDACSDALRLAPKIADMQGKLSEHANQEAVIRDLRGEVQGVLQAKRSQFDKLKTEIDSAETTRADAIKVEAATLLTLESSLSSAQDLASNTSVDATTARDTLTTYEKLEAPRFEVEVAELPALRSRRDTLDDQIDLANTKAGNISSQYGVQIANANQDAATHKGEYEKQKSPIQARFESECAVIDEAEARELVEFDSTASAQDEELESLFGSLENQKGTLQAAVDRPMASEKTVLEAQAADSALVSFLAEAGAIAAAVGAARLVKQEQQVSFDDSERRISAAEIAHGKAQKELAAAEASLKPPEGSLLSVLRAHPTDRWKSNLARIIDADLLALTTLKPSDHSEQLEAVVDGLDPLAHAFGWHLDTTVLPNPSWVDDDQAQRRHNLAVAVLQASENTLAAAKAERVKAAEKLAAAADILRKEEAKLAVSKSHQERHENRALLARERLKEETSKAGTKAKSSLNEIVKNISDLKRRRESQKETKKLARNLLQAGYTAQKESAAGIRNAAIAQLDGLILQVEEDCKATIKGLERQRDEHLSENGVDTEKLNQLVRDLRPIKERIKLLESKETLVAQWQVWCADVGRSKVEVLEEIAEKAAGELLTARGRLSDFSSACTSARLDHEQQISLLSRKREAFGADVKALEDLDIELSAFAATRNSVAGEGIENTSNADLLARIRLQRQKLAQLEATISSQFNSLRTSLTARESSVKDLVEISLSELEGQSIHRRAAGLCTAYRRIGPQIVNNVNTTLRTVLGSVKEFRNTISSFESEMRRYNKRLQDGMSGVAAPFTWLSDINLNLVTNFNELGYMKKLESLDEVIRIHASMVGVDQSSELPSDEAAAALRDFMSVIGNDGSLEINLGAHVELSGVATVKGIRKPFRNEAELANIDSNGLSNIILIALLSGMMNMIRGSHPIHVPWISDEIGKFDAANFASLMKMLRQNKIDVLTASPELTIAKQRLFARRYKFADGGVIAMYAKPQLALDMSIRAPERYQPPRESLS